MSELSESEQARQPRWLNFFFGSVQLVLVIGVLVGAIALNRILVATSGSELPAPAASLPPLVDFVVPVAGPAQVTIDETGVVQARTEVSITPQVGGRIISVAPGFADGGAFEAGEELFQIDPTDYRLRLRQAEADLNAARSSLALEEVEAQSAIREWRLINGDRAIPPLVAREPQLAQARAAVDVASAAVATARIDLSRARFTLPFDGRVLTTTIEPGLTVAPNQPYGTVYAQSGLEMRVALDPADMELLAPVIGRQAYVRGMVGARMVQAQATVIRKDSALDARSRLAGLVLAFDQEPAFLPGAFLEVTLMGPELENLLRLPAEAVSAAGMVWVIEGSVLAQRRPVILTRTDDLVLVEAFDTADGVVTVLPAGARVGLEVRVPSDKRNDPAPALAAEGD